MKLLAAAAFFEGASVGTLVEAVLQFDPRSVISLLPNPYKIYNT